MAHQEPNLDVPDGEHTRSLSDAIQSASALESVHNDDGSTTIYLQVHTREKYSTLPGLERRSWLTRVLGGRTMPSESPERSGANVRRIPRRRSDLI